MERAVSEDLGSEMTVTVKTIITSTVGIKDDGLTVEHAVEVAYGEGLPQSAVENIVLGAARTLVRTMEEDE